MPGFLSKLFRRKKNSGEEGGSKKNKKGKRGSKKDKHETSFDADPAKSDSVGLIEEDNGQIRRQGSFSNTSITGRGSNSSREQPTTYDTKDIGPNRILQQEHARVLSPHNTTREGALDMKGEKARTNALDNRQETLKVVSSHDENHDHSNALVAASSQHLSRQHLQQFELTQPIPPSQQMYHMAGDIPKQQMIAMDDMNRSDASSSSFNLSTDAEDTEYEALKRRGIVPAPLNASTLDTSAVSAVSSPTAYTTDEDHAIFPALNTDDDLTAGTGPPKEPIQPQGLLVPLQSPEEEPGRIHALAMTPHTDDDLRAWTVSPSTQASTKDSSVQSGPSPNFHNGPGGGGFHSATHGSMFDTTNNKLTSPSSTPSPSTGPGISRATPGPHRNFTSPKSTASSTDFSGAEDFANFADFSNFPTTTDMQPWSDGSRSDHQTGRMSLDKDRDHGYDASMATRSQVSTSTVSAAQTDSSLSELLAQAKGKRRGSRKSYGKQSVSSVNSAPAITAQYLRQHHNLRSYNGGYGDRERDRDSRSSTEAASVSDIIQSLEATNQSRSKGSRGSHRSLGNDGAVSHVRATKERLREKRRREREYGAAQRLNNRSQEFSSSDASDNEASESWLFDEVTGALGPRGIAADLESLSGRSNRSKSSTGNKSHKSHRSHKSHKSHRSSRRRQKSSGESVDSRGSRTSRNSRNSRYSHRSTRSYLSQMSEQSRSVANDLLRLEMQLAMVGSQENRDDVPVRATGSVGGASVGGTSRTSRTSRKSTSHRNSGGSSSISKRSKVTVIAPPGKLGIILANKADSKGTVVSGVRTSSVLAEKVSPGDRIIAIDGEDVSRMTVSEITTIMARKSDFERSLTVLTTPKHLSMGADPMAHHASLTPSKSPEAAYHHDSSYQYRR